MENIGQNQPKGNVTTGPGYRWARYRFILEQLWYLVIVYSRNIFQPDSGQRLSRLFS